jgi:acetyltransferase-like isoleucine patch superfamily enzyme
VHDLALPRQTEKRPLKEGSVKRWLLWVFIRLQYSYRKIRLGIKYFGRPIRIDASSWISSRCVIRVMGGGSITIGRNCTVHDFAMILTYGGNIEIGDHCSLNPFAIIYGHGGVRIADGVRIAAQTVIIPANHNVADDGTLPHKSGTSAKGIDIGANVWLGSGSRILDGVRIGMNAIVGAGSVVTKSVPEGATVAGVPARVIRQR